jgi:hypothetical protein
VFLFREGTNHDTSSCFVYSAGDAVWDAANRLWTACLLVAPEEGAKMSEPAKINMELARLWPRLNWWQKKYMLLLAHYYAAKNSLKRLIDWVIFWD